MGRYVANPTSGQGFRLQPSSQQGNIALYLKPQWHRSEECGMARSLEQQAVFFELDGCLDAIVAILFREPVRDVVVRQMLGDPDGPLTRESIEAVIMELGNILVSRVASAIADSIGERLLPSIPVLALGDAADQLSGLCAVRGVDPSVRVECEFVDRDAELGGLLVLIPCERR